MARKGYSPEQVKPRRSKWYFLNPDGRCSRKQFAFIHLGALLVSTILGFLLGFVQLWSEGCIVPEFLFWLGALAGWLIWFWLPFSAYLVIVTWSRRLHDLNQSGWYVLLGFVPLVNVIMIIYLLAVHGKVEGNRWAIKWESE